MSMGTHSFYLSIQLDELLIELLRYDDEMHFRSACCSETVKFLFRENSWERGREQEQGNYTALDGGLDRWCWSGICISIYLSICIKYI